MMIGTLHRRGSTPLVDLPRLGVPARRTAVLRVVLAAALIATLALIGLKARSAGSGRAAVFPEGTNTGIVALDMSASISGPIYARVASTLKGIVDANQSIGLVMFSDTAYELLPPNSPPGSLRDFIPFFVPSRYVGRSPIFDRDPWDIFRGGTRIARGLNESLNALRRAHVKHGAVLMLSDLDDSSADESLMLATALRLRQAHVPVRIIPLFASAVNKRYFQAVFGNNVFVDPKVFTHNARRHEQSIAATAPWGLILLGLALVFLLAGNERWNGRA